MEIPENSIEKLNDRLGKLTSLKYNFLIGIVRGIGTFLGASILTALVIAVLTKVVQALGGVPFLEKILENVK